MRPASPTVKFTYEDVRLFPDDRKRHELIDGEHYVTPSPRLKHQAIVGNLYWLIRSFLTDHYVSPLDVVLSRIDVVEPDLLYVANDQQDMLTESNISGPPALVVEVLSSSTRRRDETLKLELYGRMGVREYWIVDPDLETLTVYRARDDRFARIGELSLEANDALSSPMFPGLDLPLSSVFRG